MNSTKRELQGFMTKHKIDGQTFLEGKMINYFLKISYIYKTCSGGQVVP
jgi:hypothetical protein